MTRVARCPYCGSHQTQALYEKAWGTMRSRAVWCKNCSGLWLRIGGLWTFFQQTDRTEQAAEAQARGEK